MRFPNTSGIGIKPVSKEGTERLVRAAIEWALKNRRNKWLPAVSDDAKRIFYELASRTGMNWERMQRRAVSGSDVFLDESERMVDFKTAAAGGEA